MTIKETLAKQRPLESESNKDDFSEDEIKVLEEHKAGKTKFKKFDNTKDAKKWLDS